LNKWHIKTIFSKQTIFLQVVSLAFRKISFLAISFNPIDMQVLQKYMIPVQFTTFSSYTTDPLTPSTSLLGDVPPSNLPATLGITTAAIVPSNTFPGVDIVLYETLDNQQPQRLLD